MIEELVLYTTKNCPNCQMLKNILDSKKIKYKIVDDLESINNIHNKFGISNLPFLKLDDLNIYSGSEAVLYGRNL